MHINSMPDLVLRRVFSKLPLQDLFNAGHVCALWKSYQMSIGNQVRSLTLLIGPTDTHQLITKSCFTLKYRDLLLNDDGTRMYSSQYLDKRLHLIIVSLTLDGSAKLLNIFPHITVLEIAFKFVRGQFRLSPMVRLLTKWCPMLKSLKIYLKFNQNNFSLPPSIYYGEATRFVNLLDTINSMQSLEHLTLETDTSIELFLIKSIRRNSKLDFPILGQLHEFYFKSDDVGIIDNSLYRYGASNNNLKQIGLEMYTTFEDTRLQYFQFTSRITQITARTSQYKFQGTYDNLKQFSSLTNLHFTVGLFYGELNKLASLPQLTHLHYQTSKYTPIPVSASRPLPQLPSVQVLTITTNSKEISDLILSNIYAFIFPNVQVIELIIIVPLRNVLGVPFFAKQQLQSTLSTFLQCPKLHHLYTDEKFPSNLLISPDNSGQTAMPIEWIVVQEGNRKIIVFSPENYDYPSFLNFDLLNEIYYD